MGQGGPGRGCPGQVTPSHQGTRGEACRTMALSGQEPVPAVNNGMCSFFPLLLQALGALVDPFLHTHLLLGESSQANELTPR